VGSGVAEGQPLLDIDDVVVDELDEADVDAGLS